MTIHYSADLARRLNYSLPLSRRLRRILRRRKAIRVLLAEWPYRGDARPGRPSGRYGASSHK